MNVDSNPEPTATHVVVEGQEMEVSLNCPLRTCICADHDVPFQLIALPLLSTAMQKWAEAQETELS